MNSSGFAFMPLSYLRTPSRFGFSAILGGEVVMAQADITDPLRMASSCSSTPGDTAEPPTTVPPVARDRVVILHS